MCCGDRLRPPAIKRKICILHQHISVHAIIRRDRNSNANSGYDLVFFDVVGLTDRALNALCQCGRVCRALKLRHDDSEFISAQPCDHIGLSGAAAQTISHTFKQFVADRMPECVIDAFEKV
jgi:hypothetical protein